MSRYKGRLVSKGYTHAYGIEYEETFTPFARMETMRVVIAVVVAKIWYLHHTDVKDNFLHDDLQEKFYMM